MNPEKAKKLLELSARYASAARVAEARRRATSYHARDDERTETLREETVRFSGEKGNIDP